MLTNLIQAPQHELLHMRITPSNFFSLCRLRYAFGTLHFFELFSIASLASVPPEVLPLQVSIACIWDRYRNYFRLRPRHLCESRIYSSTPVRRRSLFSHVPSPFCANASR
jgi:hypothetical protein